MCRLVCMHARTAVFMCILMGTSSCMKRCSSTPFRRFRAHVSVCMNTARLGMYMCRYEHLPLSDLQRCTCMKHPWHDEETEDFHSC